MFGKGKLEPNVGTLSSSLLLSAPRLNPTMPSTSKIIVHWSVPELPTSLVQNQSTHALNGFQARELALAAYHLAPRGGEHITVECKAVREARELTRERGGQLELSYEIKVYKRDTKTMLAGADLKTVHPLGKV